MTSEGAGKTHLVVRLLQRLAEESPQLRVAAHFAAAGGCGFHLARVALSHLALQLHSLLLSEVRARVPPNPNPNPNPDPDPDPKPTPNPHPNPEPNPDPDPNPSVTLTLLLSEAAEAAAAATAATAADAAAAVEAAI